MKLAQSSPVGETLWPALLALIFSSFIFLTLLLWTIRKRRHYIRILNELLFTKPTIPLIDLPSYFNEKRFDRSALISIVHASENAILNFSGTTVVSLPLLRDHLTKQLHENSSVQVSRDANLWGLPDATICDIVEDIAKEERLDIVRTKSGNYLVVSELKEQLRDLLEVQGSINVSNEAHRLGVARGELARLIKSWGWDLFEATDGMIFSIPWLKLVLGREVQRKGGLNKKAFAQNYNLTESDLDHFLKILKWKLIQTKEDYFVPEHLLKRELLDKLEELGFVDLDAESARLRVDRHILQKILQKSRQRFIESQHGELLTLDYLRKRLQEDIDLIGWVVPSEAAKILGVHSRVVEQLLSNQKECRRVADGRYISLRAFRRWLIDEVREHGIISAKRVRLEWGLSRIDLSVLIKRFGLKTTPTRSGDFLSLSWAKHQIHKMLESGQIVSAAEVSRKFDLDEGVATALLANVETTSFQTSDGRLLPEKALLVELEQKLKENGVLDPERTAHKLGLDISDIDKVLESLAIPTIETIDGRLYSLPAILKIIQKTLNEIGVVDLQLVCQKLGIRLSQLLKLIEPHLTTLEHVIVMGECVVQTSWLQKMKQDALDAGRVSVSKFARQHKLRRRATMQILRRFLKGAYLPTSDAFVVFRG